MSYAKNTWSNGDTITAEKLNNLENGVSDAYDMRVPIAVTEEGGTLSATTDAVFSAVAAAFVAGRHIEGDVDIGGAPNIFPLALAHPKTNPILLIFRQVADVAGSGEDPQPAILELSFTADGIEASITPLAVAAD